MSENLLSQIDSPADLQKLTVEQLPQVAAEIAELIKKVVHKNGGHYASPLGVVDLTVALHYVFDSPSDPLIWDVGHQAYAHKILTGRRDWFSTLRTRGGLAGFLKRAESEHDVFGAGHASTSISAGVGIAQAYHRLKHDGHVIAIIGDGALTGGIAYEGLNNLGVTDLPMTVVLNDNRMSISPSVGSFSRYLTRIVTNPLYNRIRDEIWNATGLLPVGTKMVRTMLHRMEESLKALLIPGLLFEELGLRYFGPVDGHDYAAMLRVFRSVKELGRPSLIHVITMKGHGAVEAERDSLQYYSLAGEINAGVSNSAPDYSKVMGAVAIEMAKADEAVCFVTAAMVVGTGLSKFAELYPDRLYDVGIAEEHAVTFAAGLATQGLKPVVALYSTFMQRCFDQVMHDIALQDLPVIFCLDRAGVVGPDGPTHHGVFDMALLRTIPGLVFCAPQNGNELRDLMMSAKDWKRLVVIRYPKDTSWTYDPKSKPKLIKIGTWTTLSEGANAAILAVGSMVPVATEAAILLKSDHGIEAEVINARFVKPLDMPVLDRLIEQGRPIITLEEGLLSGGFGSAVGDYLRGKGAPNDSRSLGIGDEFIQHATRPELLEELGLTPAQVAAEVATHIGQLVK